MEPKTIILEKSHHRQLVKSIESMKRAGGFKRNAAEKALQFIGEIGLGVSPSIRLTRHGESRIKNAYKYDLGGGCRFLTLQYEESAFICSVITRNLNIG